MRERFYMRMNIDLLVRFLSLRCYFGSPSRQEIIDAVNRTATRSVLPDGWVYR